MIHADADFEEFLSEFFASEVTFDLVSAVEQSGKWPDELWQKVAMAELPWVGVSDALGGAGGSLADAAALMRRSAFHATPLPLLEHHVAAFLVGAAGLHGVDGPLSVVGLGPDPSPVVSRGRISGTVGGVAWGEAVEGVAILTKDDQGQDVVALVRASEAVKTERGRDLAGMPSPRLTFSDADVRFGAIRDAEAARRRAEVLRCALLAGLLERMFLMTNAYVRVRHQFGKPIGDFQGVQIHVVSLAQAASMADVAVHRAVAAVDGGAGALETAATAVLLDELSAAACAAAHQAHGAVGMTREYPLQLLTRRVNAWRQAWRSTSHFAGILGSQATSAASFTHLVTRHPDEELLP